MKRGTAALRDRIQRVKGQIAALDEIRSGSLTQQYNVCGQPGCRCAADPPQKHGPYYKLRVKRKGRDTTEFVRARNVARMKRQVSNYRRLKRLIEDWIDLSIELMKREERG